MAECCLCNVVLEIAAEDGIEFSVADNQDTAVMEIGNPLIIRDPDPPYEGPYTVTPSAQRKTLVTRGYAMTGNVIIEPIPQNYGLVTYNGSIITIS